MSREPKAESREPLWRRYLRFFGPHSVADLEDEIRFHVEMRVRDYIARGMTEAEARQATAQRLGDMATARATAATIAAKKDTCMRRAQILDALTQDVSFALRTLGRQKAWTAVAVLTLSLGIGVSSGMFSVLNHLLLHPLSYPNADRVAVVYQLPSQGSNMGMNVTMIPPGRVVSAWREDAKSFEAIEPYTTTQTLLDRPGDEPQSVATARVLPTFPAFTGERPLRGRVFTAQEARDGANVVLISERMWRSRFGAQDSVIGQTFVAFDKTQTVIGVMPESFQLPRTMEEAVDVWAPMDLTRSADDGVQVVARLRPGVTRVAAAAELDSITARRDLNGKREPYTTFAGSPTAFLSIKDSLTMMGIAVALVLLIACANVAHLLLARGSSRQREMAIRAALGAGRGRLFRQLVTESVVLSVAGSIGGLAVGWLSLKALLAARPSSLTELSAVHVDWWTLSVTGLIAAATSIVFGLIGGSQAARQSTSDALKSSADRASQGRLSAHARSLLVVTEMAFCTMLLVGAILLIRSLVYLQTRDTGFDAHGLYTLDVSLPAARYPKDTRFAFHRQLAERAAKAPGVAGVTIAAAPPMSQTFLIGALQVGGQPDPEKGTSGFIACNSVEPGYFALMRMRMLRGTTFTDTTDAAAQVIVNESMERQLWPGQSAMGRRMRVAYNGTGQWRTVVGVVADALNSGRTDRGSPLLFLPPASMFGSTVIVRAATNGNEPAVARQVADLALQIDPTLRRPSVTSVEWMMDRSLSRPRFVMLLLSLFAAIAVGLAAIGLYGVLAYSVAQRTREIGIRVALGATRGDVARGVLTQGVGLAVAGAVLGLVGARGGVSVVSKLLYGVQGNDVLSFALSAAALVVIAVLACLVPTRRALSVDPLIAMKAE